MSSTLDTEHPFSGLGIVDYAVAYLHYVSEEDTLVYHSVSKICLPGNLSARALSFSSYKWERGKKIAGDHIFHSCYRLNATSQMPCRLLSQAGFNSHFLICWLLYIISALSRYIRMLIPFSTSFVTGEKARGKGRKIFCIAPGWILWVMN